MRLKVKDLDISTGDVFIATLNNKDAEKFDLFSGDRIEISKGKKKVVTAINITNSKKIVPEGSIGIYRELQKESGFKPGDTVSIGISHYPNSLHYIRKKLRGKRLSQEEFDEIIGDIVTNKLTRVEVTYFVSACYIHELTVHETIYLTRAILKTGQTISFNTHPVVDKHCIGGVAGNRTTMIVVPIVAAAGLLMPKTSSRSITSPAGTADTMEVLAKVSFDIKRLKGIVQKTGGCMVWGGTMNLAPADDKIINVEHEVSLDPKGQLLASILAKKKSVSATHLLIDIPVGGKIKSRKDSIYLKQRFEEIGRSLGFKIKVVLTDGRQPIGNGIGPVFEARDVLWVLKNDKRAPKDLRDKSVMLAGMIFELAGKRPHGQGAKLAEQILISGKAYKKFAEIVKAQGGKSLRPDKLKIGKFKYTYKAPRDGTIHKISNRFVSKLAKIAGAPKDKEAGIYLYVLLNQKVNRGNRLFTIYSDNKDKLARAKKLTAQLDTIKII